MCGIHANYLIPPSLSQPFAAGLLSGGCIRQTYCCSLTAVLAVACSFTGTLVVPPADRSSWGTLSEIPRSAPTMGTFSRKSTMIGPTPTTPCHSCCLPPPPFPLNASLAFPDEDSYVLWPKNRRFFGFHSYGRRLWPKSKESKRTRASSAVHHNCQISHVFLLRALREVRVHVTRLLPMSPAP